MILSSVAAKGSVADDPVWAEITWLLDTECTAVFERLRVLLRDCSIALLEADEQTGAPLRCGSDDEGLMVAAVLGASELTAMRIQLTLPKQDLPYSAMLAGGQKFSLPLPALVTMKNRVAQAIAALNQGHASLKIALATVRQVLSLVSDAIAAIALRSPPEHTPRQVSSIAPTLTAQMQPAPPSNLTLDIFVAGSPPRVYFSATMLRPADGSVLETRQVSVATDSLERRMEYLEAAAREARGLLGKLETLNELADEIQPPHRN